MYGKIFASTFTGSMFGAGSDVFAVWGYVIANAQDSRIELNPRMLASTLGSTPLFLYLQRQQNHEGVDLP